MSGVFPERKQRPATHAALDGLGVLSGEVIRHAAPADGATVPVKLDPARVQICRVDPIAYDNGQPCACPVGTCSLWRGGLRPAGAREDGNV
jgi:hypothetical protein